MVSLKRSHIFSLCNSVFFPAVANIGRQGRLMLLTNTNKYMTPLHALIFEKHIKMCVYIEHIKNKCKFITLMVEYLPQKNGWEVVFSEHGFAGSGACKPRWELKGSTLNFFSCCSEALLYGAVIVQVKYHIKASAHEYLIW